MFRALSIVIVKVLLMVPSASGESVYVWDVETRSGGKDEMTRNFTVEIEAVLSSLAEYRVVEGRVPEQLLAHRQHVGFLRDVLGADNEVTGALRKFSVDTVVIGELYDDRQDGSFVLTLTFLGLEDGTKHTRSDALSRGKIHDRESRVAFVRRLIETVSIGTATRVREDVDRLIWELKRCTLSGRRLACHLTLINNGEDRTISIVTRDAPNNSRVFDDTGQVTTGAVASIAGTRRNTTYGPKTLVLNGLETAVVIVFGEASSTMGSISRLDIIFWIDERDGEESVVTFRNIDVIRK